MGSSRTDRKPARQPWIAGAAAVLATGGLVTLVLWRSTSREHRAVRPAAAPSAAATAPDWFLSADLPALPNPRAPLPRAPFAVRAAYEFAARHPEVLENVPCFCGCDKLGHRSNHDCFVAARDGAGRVTWGAHGMG